MTFCKGERLSKIPNSRKYWHFDGSVLRIGSLVAFYCGILDRMLEAEGFTHGDRALRHLLFYADVEEGQKNYSLSVIDWEKSRKAALEEITRESEKFRQELFGRFSHTQAKKSFEDGRRIVEPLNLAGLVYERVLETLRQKFGNRTITPNIEEGTLSIKLDQNH